MINLLKTANVNKKADDALCFWNEVTETHIQIQET